MTERSQKKNYYFLQTMLKEIPKYDTVSFGIFDTLIFRGVLFPQDIFRLVAKDADEMYGVKDYNYVRQTTEEKVRAANLQRDNTFEDVTLSDIYSDIRSIHPDIPVDKLWELEAEYEKRNVFINPIAKELYDKAVSEGKRIVLIADSCLPRDLVAQMLSFCDITEYSAIYLSGENHKLKSTGSLYKHACGELDADYSSWLHIGSDYAADITAPRSLGITAAYLRSPRDWFMLEREKKQKESDAPLPPIDDSLEFSASCAHDINERFTATLPPSDEVAISATGIHMMFNMSKEKVDNIKEYVIRFMKRQLSFKEFWALKGVDLVVRRGEKVGLVGLNGSGKSTMLKIVSGVLSPTKGKVSVSGAIAPMIELGAGFDSELSARENIYLNGSILGYSRKQMDKYYDGIIEFSELQDFQDVAIKNFSSGMVARLGFAIATCNVPDILIIDEILSVGDFEFQKKCHKKMEELTGKGATVLFVSHSASDIIGMCDRALWLDHGNLVAEGEAQYIVEKYLG